MTVVTLFTVYFSHLRYKILHVHEAISGYFVVSAQNCLASTLNYIAMQVRKANPEKGYIYETTTTQQQHQQ